MNDRLVVSALDQNSGKEKERYELKQIGMMDISNFIRSKLLFILSVTLLLTLVSILFSLWIPKTYLTECVILPPLAKNVEKINIPGIYEIDVKEVYNRFIRNVNSHSLRLKFFNEHGVRERFQGKSDGELTEYDIFNKNFNQMIEVYNPARRNEAANRVTIALEGKDPELIAQWLNDFIQFIDDYTVKSIDQAIKTKVSMGSMAVAEKIDSLRNVAKSRRLDLIVQLEEAELIAKRIGYATGVSFSDMADSQTGSGRVSMNLNTEENPLYLRGSRALRAEIEALKVRKSDDPFIPTLRDLQEELGYLSKIAIDIEGLHAVRIDQGAMKPTKIYRPNRLLIALWGMVFGFTLSLVLIFLRGMLQNRHETV